MYVASRLILLVGTEVTLVLKIDHQQNFRESFSARLDLGYLHVLPNCKLKYTMLLLGSVNCDQFKTGPA